MVARAPQSLHLDINVLPADFLIYLARLHQGDRTAVGYCLAQPLLGQDERCSKTLVVWHIYVEPAFRRQGIGRMILFGLKRHWERIETGVTSQEGRELCLACGFAWRRGLFNADEDAMVWEKKEAGHAKGNGEKAESRSPEEGAEREKG